MTEGVPRRLLDELLLSVPHKRELSLSTKINTHIEATTWVSSIVS